MKVLWFLLPCVHAILIKNPLRMSQSPPPAVWTYLSSHLKDTARNWFIGRAEKAGVPWSESVARYSDEYSRMSLDMWMRRLENVHLDYPRYFLQPFHGYDKGNMEWKAALEGEAATWSITSHYWEKTDPFDAERWMRYNVSQHIRHYCKSHHVPVESLKCIVDLGCSVGISTEYLTQSFRGGKRYIGVDLSPYFVAMAAHRADKAGHDINYIHANAECVPLQNNTCDLITCNFLLHEVPHVAAKKILKEARRLLKPNGVLAIVDLDPHVLNYQLKLHPFRKWAFEVTEPHIHDYYQHDLGDCMCDHGFSNVEKRTNDPLNSVWLGKKNMVSVQTLPVRPLEYVFAMG